ncbi:MAG: glycosyltransferase family 9 protein [Candidatus Krumholzibacteriia bacterium]
MPQRLLVIRFGALGDLCLLAWSLARLASASPRVTLVTKEAFAGLASAFPGVDEVVPLRGRDLRALGRLAGELRGRRHDAVVDAHGVLRARVLSLLLGRRVDRRLQKDTAARLRLLLHRRGSPRLQRTMRTRFDALLEPFAAPGVDASQAPPLAGWAAARLPAPGANAGRPPARALGFAPGARWPTKRWPIEHATSFLHAFRRASAAPVRLFLGPDEEAWFAGSTLEQAAATVSGVELVARRPLTDVALALAGCAATVTSDSGLLHLSELVGTPVVALFGPTVREFGYAPTLPRSRLLEMSDLRCRPCSRNGRRPCWRGDLACLAEIGPERVLAAALAVGGWSQDSGSTEAAGLPEEGAG